MRARLLPRTALVEAVGDAGFEDIRAGLRSVATPRELVAIAVLARSAAVA